MGETGLPSFEELFLTVSDVQRSKEFYIVRLGLKAEYEGDDFVILRAGKGPTILLHDAGGEPVAPGTFGMEIRVADVDRLYVELSRKGLHFGREPFEVSHEGDRWSPRREARLTDPDGYGITLFTPLKTK